MNRTLLRTCASVLAIGAAGFAMPAFAADKDAAKDTDTLDTIVVTASSGNRTKLDSSISVTQVTQVTITNFTPRSQAEVLRAIPGLNVQDTAGPGGNANIGVRGIPVSTGGSEYVGLQEDGLPVVLFGDMQFGNNDYWVRFDNSVDRVEAVRGGSSSTFASQAPGAVINYVSKTGDKEGGQVGLSSALNYREQRLDFDYGAHLSDSVRFHIGGYLVNGNGPTHLAYTAEKGYQIKANITKDFADGKGYIRLNFKRLDDQEPTFTSMPSLVTVSGGNVSGFSTFAGVDARQYSSTGIYNQTFQILNRSGQLQTVEMQGIHPVATAFGGEFHYEFTPTFSVTDKARWTSMSGSFSNQWTGETATSSVIGSSVNGSTVAAIRYAAGPNQGKAYTGAFLSNSAQALTTINDVGSLANDLSLDGKFDLGNGNTVKAHAGWFFMRQTIAMDWRINNAYQTLNSTNDPVPLDLFAAAGTQLTANGLSGFNNQWGGCCGGRAYNVQYTDNAPYMELDGTFGGLDLDASIRYDSVKATGNAYAPTAGANVTVTDALGSASLPTLNTAASPVNVLNYTKSYASWSVGALYRVTNDTSLFVRASSGGRFNADRLLYGSAYNADGSLNAGGDHLSVNRVTQQEVGLKHRGRAAGGTWNAELTFYRAQVKESNYDFTAPSRGANPYTDTVFHSYGIEASASGHWGPFRLDSYVVYTHSIDTSTGFTPAAMPKITYFLAPTYDAGVAAVGLALTGQSKFYINNTTTVSGSSFVNAFVKVRPIDRLELGLNANNLFNKLGYRANNGSLQAQGQGGLSANQALFDNSAMLGRTVTASLRYSF